MTNETDGDVVPVMSYDILYDDLCDLRGRIQAAMDAWPRHDVGACQDFACKDCVVEACRDDITNALATP